MSATKPFTMSALKALIVETVLGFFIKFLSDFLSIDQDGWGDMTKEEHLKGILTLHKMQREKDIDDAVLQITKDICNGLDTSTADGSISYAIRQFRQKEHLKALDTMHRIIGDAFDSVGLEYRFEQEIILPGDKESDVVKGKYAGEYVSNIFAERNELRGKVEEWEERDTLNAGKIKILNNKLSEAEERNNRKHETIKLLRERNDQLLESIESLTEEVHRYQQQSQSVREQVKEEVGEVVDRVAGDSDGNVDVIGYYKEMHLNSIQCTNALIIALAQARSGSVAAEELVGAAKISKLTSVFSNLISDAERIRQSKDKVEGSIIYKYQHVHDNLSDGETDQDGGDSQ